MSGATGAARWMPTGTSMTAFGCPGVTSSRWLTTWNTTVDEMYCGRRRACENPRTGGDAHKLDALVAR